MSTPAGNDGGRSELLNRLAQAGRDLNDAAVMFHTAVAERFGLGPTDWKMLSLLERQGALTAGELVRLSGLKPASVTAVLDRLEREKWVRRRRSEDDQRRVIVELDTSLRVRQRSTFRPLMQRLNDIYSDYSNEELRLLANALAAIAAAQKEATAEITDAGSP